MICGEVKPGTYTSGYPFPVCGLDRGHVGMHDATVDSPSYFVLIESPQLPPLKQRYQWSGQIEIQGAVL